MGTSHDERPDGLTRLILRWIDLTALLTPAGERDRWKREWKAEVWHRSDRLRGRGWPVPRIALHLAGRAFQAPLHALWLRRKGWHPEMIIQDLTYGIRSLTRRPGFTAVAVLTLAMGIGVNTALFSAVDAVVLSPLPVEEPEELVRINDQWPNGFPYGSISYPLWQDVRERADVLEDVFAYRSIPLSLSAGEEPERVWGAIVTSNYFDLLGVGAARGRLFSLEEVPGQGQYPYAVLSYRFWQERFGGSEEVIGRAVTLNGHPMTIIGAAREGFRGTQKGYAPQMWVPMVMQLEMVPGRDRLNSRGAGWLVLTGRLAEGVSIQQADEVLDAVMAGLGEEYPGYHEDHAFHVMPEREAGITPIR